MSTTLLESKARPFGSSKGVALSMVLHTALLAAILFGTARSVLPPREKVEAHPVLYVATAPPPVHVAPDPLPAVKPRVAAPKRSEAPRPRIAQPVPKAAPTPALIAPTRVALSLPAVDLKAPVISDVVVAVAAEPARSTVTTSGGDVRKPGDDAADGGTGAKGSLGSGSSGRAYDVNQVDREVEVSRAVAPKYPAALRSVNVTGAVAMRYIVSAEGRVEPGSIEVISTPHKLFGDAVRTALLTMRFRPAEANGQKVRQLVEQTFTFKLDKDAGEEKP